MTAEANAPHAEQRKQIRVTIPEHPQIVDMNKGEVLGQLVNLSVEGLMVISQNCVECGTVCQLRIPLNKGNQSVEVTLGAVSLWCEDANESGAYWTGFQIIDISPENQEMLNSIVEG